MHIAEVKDKTFAISELTKIDDGGEGIVYLFPKIKNKVIKIFSPTSGNSNKKAANFELCMNLKKQLLEGLEKFATIPEYRVIDDSNGSPKMVGYVMENCQGWWELSSLFDPEFRKENGFGFPDIALVFLKIHLAISSIHEKGFVIGDLNSRNILIRPKSPDDADPFFEIRIIDTDSWGIHRPDIGLVFEPSALDELILHPNHRKAAANGTKLSHTQKEDWWSFALLLANSLLSFDPFSAGNTLTNMRRNERVENGLTVWLSDVRKTRTQNIAATRVGVKMKTMLDRWLKCSNEGEFPRAILFDFYEGIVRCKGKDWKGRECHLQFHKSLPSCPNCGTIA